MAPFWCTVLWAQLSWGFIDFFSNRQIIYGSIEHYWERVERGGTYGVQDDGVLSYFLLL